MKEAKNRYYIKNQYLKKMISNDPKNEDIPYTGMSSGKGLGTALLTYFVKKMLNIHRLPFCEDRHFSNDFTGTNTSNKINILNKLSEVEIQNITKELNIIYEFTQDSLHDVEYKILSRRVHNSTKTNYGDLLYKLKKYSEILGEEYIEVNMDILNSFSDGNSYGRYPIKLELKIPKKNILYCHKFMDKDIVESGEWVVINDSPNGIVQIPISSIKIDDENSFKDISLPTDVNAAQDFLNRYKGFSLHLHTNIDKNQNSIYHGEIIKPTLKTIFKIVLDIYKNGYPIYKNV